MANHLPLPVLAVHAAPDRWLPPELPPAAHQQRLACRPSSSHSGVAAHSVRGRRSSEATDSGRTVDGFVRNPVFPELPRSTPLTLVLAMKACLSADLADRPKFVDLHQIFADSATEVASGSYVDSSGQTQVYLPLHVSGVLAACACTYNPFLMRAPPGCLLP